MEHMLASLDPRIASLMGRLAQVGGKEGAERDAEWSGIAEELEKVKRDLVPAAATAAAVTPAETAGGPVEAPWLAAVNVDDYEDSGSDTDDSVDSTLSSSEVRQDLVSSLTSKAILTNIEKGGAEGGHAFSRRSRTFGVRGLDGPVEILQDYGNVEETGGAVYDSSLVLLDFLLSPPSPSSSPPTGTPPPPPPPPPSFSLGSGGGLSFLLPSFYPEPSRLRLRNAILSGGTVIELGAGPGLVSVALGLAGGTVIATDGSSQVLPLLTSNLQKHSVPAQVLSLQWGDASQITAVSLAASSLPRTSTPPPTTIVLSDTVYPGADLASLASTLRSLSNQIRHHGSPPTIVLAHPKRSRGAEVRLLRDLSSSFAVHRALRWCPYTETSESAIYVHVLSPLPNPPSLSSILTTQHFDGTAYPLPEEEYGGAVKRAPLETLRRRERAHGNGTKATTYTLPDCPPSSSTSTPLSVCVPPPDAPRLARIRARCERLAKRGGGETVSNAGGFHGEEGLVFEGVWKGGEIRVERVGWVDVAEIVRGVLESLEGVEEEEEEEANEEEANEEEEKERDGADDSHLLVRSQLTRFKHDYAYTPIPPTPGTVAVFPGYSPHAVAPSPDLSSSPRVTVACNVIREGEKVKVTGWCNVSGRDCDYGKLHDHGDVGQAAVVFL